MSSRKGPGGGPTHNIGGKLILIDEKEASRLLNISVRKLGEMRKAGEIPFIRVGGSIRYGISALEEWVCEGLRGGFTKATPHQNGGGD